MPERWEFRCGTNRACNKSRLSIRGKLLRNVLRELNGSQIDFRDSVLQPKFAENGSRRAEGIGLNNVATHPEEVGMNIANDVRPAQDEHFAAIFFSPIVVQSGIT